MSHGLTEIVKPGFTNSVDYHMIAGLDSDTARSTLITINHGLLSADHVGSRWSTGDRRLIVDSLRKLEIRVNYHDF